MIVFTEGGETPEEIVNRYLGYNDASKSQQVKTANLDSYAWQMMNGSGVYSRNRALWFPIDGEHSHPEDQAAIVHEFDWLTYQQRDMLRQLQNNNINIHHVVNAHKTTRFANLAMMGGEFVGESLHAGLDLGSKARESFKKTLERAKMTLTTMAEATDEELAQQATQEFKRIYQQVATEYTHYLKELNAMERYTLEQPWAVIRGLRKHGWYIDDIFTAKNLSKVIKFLKWTKVGGYLALAIEGGVETYDTWKETHDWEKTLKMATKAIGDVLVGFAAVGIAFLVLGIIGITSPAWGTCFLVGAAATGATTWFDTAVLNPLIEKS